jgi:hypothetical protein
MDGNGMKVSQNCRGPRKSYKPSHNILMQAQGTEFAHIADGGRR